MSDDFVKKTLGFWSSHPANLERQKKLLLFLGILPVVAVAVACVLFYEDLFRWEDFKEQIGFLTCAFFFSFGFLVTLSVLYLACFTVGSKGEAFSDRDQLIFPLWWLPVGFFVILLLLNGLSALPELPLLKKLAERYPSLPFLKFDFKLGSQNLSALLNMLAISPLLCILTWILCAKEEKLEKNEKLVRRPAMLWAALGCIGLLCASFFIPRYRLAMWVFTLPLSLIFLTLWWFWRKKVAGNREQTAEQKADGEQEEPEIPVQAQVIIERLKESGRKGISYDKDGGRQSAALPEGTSPHIKEDAEALPLIALMNGMSSQPDRKIRIPTIDQKDFLDRFIGLYEKSLTDLLPGKTLNSEQTLPDIILQGREGSGRTEALCAAAVHAVVARGQNVLYLVQDEDYAISLAAKMNSRFKELLMDSYYTAGDMHESPVADWLKQESVAEDDESESATENNKRKLPAELPPNILFATPLQIERDFFSNHNLLSDGEKRTTLRNILIGFSVILVDDFLEMPLPLQAHLAFILDKFRLLQASEYVKGQFVVVTTPLNDAGIETLASRLFGLSEFSSENVVLLRPRPCEPFWCGTLRISPAEFGGGDRVLEDAAELLLRLCVDEKFSALLYSKEINQDEARQLEENYKKDGGRVSVASRLYQLDVNKMPYDTIFYLSLTGGNAAAALRLSLPDEKAGTPVFFRIALENEPEKEEPENRFALLPDEKTAISLRAFHLRSILPFLRPLTPVSAVAWSHFGITFDQDLQDGRIDEGTNPVKWYYDHYTESDRYTEETIWPYLVLDSQPAISNAGKKVELDILPSTKDSIMQDSSRSGERGEALYFVSGEEKQKDPGIPSQLAVWRDDRNTYFGKTDLAHSDQLTLVARNNVYSYFEFLEKAAGKDDAFAMVIKPRIRRGLSPDIPLRRFSWELPEGGFSVPKLDGGLFRIIFGASHTNLVSAEIRGVMNSLARAEKTDPVRNYAYDAYMSCFVFLPAENCSRDGICKCLAGKWSTEAASGFSAPLSHAFFTALRKRIEGFSFFAMAPVFLIGGRDGSFGQLLLWLLEPYNSGIAVYPLLVKQRHDPDFMRKLFEDVEKILVRDNGDYVTLKELRRLSQMAFAEEEKLTREQWTSEIKRGLDVIRQLLRDSGYPEDDEGGLEDELKTLEEERRKRFEEYIDFSGRTEEERRQFKEFTAQVTADLMDFKDAVDLTRFCTEYGWSEEKVKENFFDVLWNSPEIFFVAKSFCCEVERTPEGTIVSCILRELIYGIRKEEFADAKARLERAAAEAMKSLAGVADPVKKALKLHDYIIDICDYDEEARDKKDPTPLARTAYSVLVRHRAVCEGYTMAYRYLLNLAGIKSEEVNSNDMNHCWNYVNLDGHWYHVDVTWDDPVYRGGKPKNAGISHEYFLLSDEKIRSREHHDWSVRGLPPASDTKYDDMNWNS